jgi:RimJ/RimL family protein N-acetyltransferase
VRVEFKTDSLNEKSRAALLRIGAVEEGTLRNHMIMPDGRRRHSVYFSVVEEEWPGVKTALEERLRGQAGAPPA